jgi:hypothetical protein
MVEATQSYRERMKAARAKRQAAKAEWVRSVELMATARMMALDAVKRTIRGRETALHITRMLSWESRQTRCWDIAVCAGVYTRPISSTSTLNCGLHGDAAWRRAWVSSPRTSSLIRSSRSLWVGEGGSPLTPEAI